MKNLAGLKVSICQMPVKPGKIEENAKYVIAKIHEAKKQGMHIVVFPEMCITGYVIGDMFELDEFVKDAVAWNKLISEATKCGIIAIWGNVVVDPTKKNENGRIRLYNAYLVAQNGKLIDWGVKTLQPNYRFFHDDRYFFSMRKLAEEKGIGISELLKPIMAQTSIGELNLGVSLCEDMWSDDYFLNPIQTLVDNGADIIINLSASPWTWQKNRKRHQVVKNLLLKCKVPFIYCNNTGTQNAGKNIIVFDGSSTIYRPDGLICHQVVPYFAGLSNFEFTDELPVIKIQEANDVEQLYQAMKCSVGDFLMQLPESVRRIYIGLSGGIDSALVCAMMVDILGPDKVIAINMPGDYSGEQCKIIAGQIADNLGIRYETIPIGNITKAIAQSTGSLPDTLNYENIQARCRMEILASLSQGIEGKYLPGVYTCNGNKVEMAFGYATLYADMAGAVAPLADLVKREVRELANYYNEVVFGREIIPQLCINQKPTAELKTNQIDPFDYGGLDRRGYHDEMVRAFTEFRKGPEWILELYLQGKLEQEFKLEVGTLKKLFATDKNFVKDLQEKWEMFNGKYFKRLQSTIIPVFTRRAFGGDLTESILPAHYSNRWFELVKLILCQRTDSSFGE